MHDHLSDQENAESQLLKKWNNKMKTSRNNKTIKTAAFALTLFFTGLASAGWLSISDSQIPYLAMVKGNTERSFIVSNPDLCKQVPGPCRFFIQHAHGHRHLNHLIFPPKSYLLTDEMAADCFAARTVAGSDVLETYGLLLKPEEAKKYSIPGDLAIRAENIKTCAMKSENWVGK